MNLKTTLILFAFLALAVAALLLTNGGGVSTDQTSTDPKQHGRDEQPILEADSLGPALRDIWFYTQPDSANLHLTRSAGRWRVAYPHHFPAASRVIDELLTLLSDLRGTAQPDDAEPATDGRSLTLSDGKREITLTLSPRLGAGRAGLTVRRGEHSTYYIADDALHDLFDDLYPPFFFATSLDAPLMPDIARIEITSEQAQSSLVQEENRWWIESNGQRERALDQSLPSHASISDYFKLLAAMEIIEHQPYEKERDLAQFGLDRPLITATLIPFDDVSSHATKAWVLNVGVPADPADQSRYVSFGPADDPNPAVFTASTRFALAVGQTATAFRDPRIITTPPTLIESITIGTGSHRNPFDTLDLQTDGSATLTDSDAGLVQPVAIDRLNQALSDLADARAMDYVPGRASAFKEIATISIKPRLDGVVERLTVCHAPDNGTSKTDVLVFRQHERVGLRVARSAVLGLIETSKLVEQE